MKMKGRELVENRSARIRNVSGEQRAVNTTAPGREAEHLHVFILIAYKNLSIAVHTHTAVTARVDEMSISAVW